MEKASNAFDTSGRIANMQNFQQSIWDEKDLFTKASENVKLE